MSANAVIAEYMAHGWKLIPIAPGKKSPTQKHWNERGAALADVSILLPDWGVGLLHAYSGTMAFDIDDISLTNAYGVNVNALYAAEDAVIIRSGKPGHGKLLYQMPFGLTLPSLKVTAKQGNGKPATIFELRCATHAGLSVQDVLPPSVHPADADWPHAEPYQWAGSGHWSRLPVVPDELLNLWLDRLKEETPVPGDPAPGSWEDIEAALKFINPDCPRADWIAVGMGLHWVSVRTNRDREGLMIWNRWSSASYKYPGEPAILQQWRSFKIDRDTPITDASIFHLAKQNGWAPPPVDASAYFADVTATSPDQISQSLRPLPPQIDLALWPEILRVRAQEVSESVGCDLVVPLFAGLAAVCGVADARTRLELMPGFRVPPVLWLMTIGDPADKKSPGSRPMLAPLKEIESEDRVRYQKELLDWEAREKVYSVAKEAFLKFWGTPDALMGAQAPDVPERPKEPVAVKITVGDITSQKLVRQAADRPRGLLCHLDEMASWCYKLADKRSGEDRSAWVVSYESERYEMDRVGAGSVHCDNLAVSIYGNIQPKVFRESLLALSTDGLLQRFIPAVLTQSKTRLGHPVPDFMTHAVQWEQTLRLIFSFPVMTYRLSEAAYEVFRSFQAWYETSKLNERLIQAGDTYMTAYGKLEGLTGRLILLFHLVECPFNPVVDAALVKRVISVVRGYIVPAFRYALGEIGSTNTTEQWLTEYIIQHADEKEIDLSRLRISGRRQFEKMSTWEANQSILGWMAMLEKSNWVVRTDDGKREVAGKAEWVINPSLITMFREYRERVIRARQAIKEAVYVSSERPSSNKARVHGYHEIEGR